MVIMVVVNLWVVATLAWCHLYAWQGLACNVSSAVLWSWGIIPRLTELEASLWKFKQKTT